MAVHFIKLFSNKGEATNFVGNFIEIKEDLLVNERRTNATNMEIMVKMIINFYSNTTLIIRPHLKYCCPCRFVSNKSLL
jgi:hypothetical protein